MPEKPITNAQAFVLDWINQHGAWKYPNQPDGYRWLGIPPAHRRAFGTNTLNVLVKAEYLAVRGRDAFAEYDITDLGKQALETYQHLGTHN